MCMINIYIYRSTEAPFYSNKSFEVNLFKCSQRYIRIPVASRYEGTNEERSLFEDIT